MADSEWEAQKDLIHWVNSHNQVLRQIANGAARGLYSIRVAEIAAQHLEHVEEQLTEQLVNAVAEAKS